MTKTADLKGSNFTLSVLHLPNDDVALALNMLEQKVAQAPSFFASAPVVVNIENVSNEINFVELKSGVERTGMIPVGITGCKDKQKQAQATAAGFAVMTSFTPQQVTQKANMQPTKVVKTPIRSGQQIYAKDADLVILNNVSPGAEVIADGSIHIHGTLRGRAIAGASGQAEAKVFCKNLQAELISIAGNYWLSDQIDKEYWHQNVMITMVEDRIQIDTLTL
ncbi:septum site-determining protein MinC [Aliivibrio sp. S10_S31]|uniref:septum site-determining protein MinC n=1 Tax=Aliivibrio sp. S10_S31 TaxID=2720224 RepID=UPI0016815857|nr:septum site-determining protein MinC [Aliivibrio sp. S10_S31]MBD1568721.1 septum site-determining protein MinC [Aliivibrio sp. S10_S31]